EVSVHIQDDTVHLSHQNYFFFFFSSRRRHTRFSRDWSSDVCSSDLFASAESGAGIPELLQVFERLMPNPAEGNPPPFLKGSGEGAERVPVTPDPARHVVAHVFKVSIDPYVGKLGVLRVHQGTVRPGSQLFVGDARKPIT